MLLNSIIGEADCNILSATEFFTIVLFRIIGVVPDPSTLIPPFPFILLPLLFIIKLCSIIGLPLYTSIPTSQPDTMLSEI